MYANDASELTRLFAELDTLAAALDQRQAAHDAVLAQIADQVKAEKAKGMDPALVAEGKVLLE